MHKFDSSVQIFFYLKTFYVKSFSPKIAQFKDVADYHDSF